MAEALRLNLGCGKHVLAGYVNLDRSPAEGVTVGEAFPLAYPDGSADEVRASHILEHFPKEDEAKVLAEWTRVLKPGGVLKVAVPDFDKIIDAYRDPDNDWNVEGFLLGGQKDSNDFHKTLWDREKLKKALETVGLRDVTDWKSDVPDCAALPVSLNLQATKLSSLGSARSVTDAPAKKFRVAAVMSVPRLGFMDNFFCAFSALTPLGIPLRKTQGAFWGQCLERGLMTALAEGFDAILTIDYDTIFSRADVERLVYLMMIHPEADAIAALQAARHVKYPLMTVKGPDGLNRTEFDERAFAGDLFKCSTAHFGLTLLRSSALRDLDHPWFHAKPAADGSWSEGRTDDDIWFWRQWEVKRKTLYIAPRVAIGHAELMIMWPGKQLDAIFQYSKDYQAKASVGQSGKPEGVWK